jgi:xanthine dehydrogenase accessory factor
MDALLIKKLDELLNARQEIALVTVTEKAGSGPRGCGSMMIVAADGTLLYGTVGGGGVEEQAKKDAAVCIRENVSKSFHYELTLKETDHSLHMACGGIVDVFIKVFKNQDHLLIIGGGHIGIDLSFMAKRLGYYVTVLDEREDYGNSERFPHVDRVKTGNLLELINQTSIDEKTSVVIITHGHSHDLEALRAVIDRGGRYVGLIGSKSKLRFCFDELRNEGVTDALLNKVHAPIGLDIGGETPAEIALAILAEIQAVRYNKTGQFLKNLKEI